MSRVPEGDCPRCRGAGPLTLTTFGELCAACLTTIARALDIPTDDPRLIDPGHTYRIVGVYADFITK